MITNYRLAIANQRISAWIIVYNSYLLINIFLNNKYYLWFLFIIHIFFESVLWVINYKFMNHYYDLFFKFKNYKIKFTSWIFEKKIFLFTWSSQFNDNVILWKIKTYNQSINLMKFSQISCSGGLCDPKYYKTHKTLGLYDGSLFAKLIWILK